MSVSLAESGPSADMGEEPADREEMFQRIVTKRKIAEGIADTLYWERHIEEQPVIE